jgi:hypothetical protein
LIYSICNKTEDSENQLIILKKIKDKTLNENLL